MFEGAGTRRSTDKPALEALASGYRPSPATRQSYKERGRATTNAGAGVVSALQLDPSEEEQMELIDAPPLPGNTPPASPLRAAPNMTWDILLIWAVMAALRAGWL